MSRLTKYIEGTACIDGHESDGCCEVCETVDSCSQCPIGKIIDKLAHYEDLEEAGRLIELPCKVGDTVWCVTDKYIFVAWVDSFYLTEEDGVLSIEVNLTDVVENDIEIKASSFGRKVFLTKAEAEAKLVELKEGAE